LVSRKYTAIISFIKEQIMVKTYFKLFLCAVLLSILFMITNILLPFSQGLKELNSSGSLIALLFLFINSAWTCITVFYVIKHTDYTGEKLFFNLLFVIFFIQYFMTQIETLFFGHAFTALTKLDIILLMLAGFIPLLGAIALLVKFFQNKNTELQKREKINIKNILIKLGITGVIYLCMYMLFGYFVAWQFKELRLFYSGSVEKLSFWGQMANNIKTNPTIIPFQILRGILFGIAVIPIRCMINKKSVFIISVCLIYLCTAVILIIPNALFPDMVRIAHLIEMFSSMLLFGIIVGNVLWNDKEIKICA